MTHLISNEQREAASERLDMIGAANQRGRYTKSEAAALGIGGDPTFHPCSKCRIERIHRSGWHVCPKCGDAIPVPIPPSIRERMQEANAALLSAAKALTIEAQRCLAAADAIRMPLELDEPEPQEKPPF